MIDDVLDLIKKAIRGDEAATDILFSFFREKKLSQIDQEAIYQYVRQGGQQNPHAIYLHAFFYDEGYVVKQNADMAFLLMREAAAKGHAKATYEVGRRFLEGIGVEKNTENALQWLEIAAGSPNYVSDAMYKLGRIYEQGLGVDIDLKQASAWYEKAAEKGHSAAKTKLDHLNR